MKSIPKNAHYVSNSDFLKAMIEYKAKVNAAKAEGKPKPPVTNYIGECFLKIANHLAYKSNFINYTYRDEMILDGIENCITYIDNFDPDKSSNPFAYFTQITYYAFIRRIQKEKKQQVIKSKYIKSLDFSDLITQDHDGSDYSNEFIEFIKKQLDTAEMDKDVEPEKKKVTRRPKYFDKPLDPGLDID